MTVSGSRINWDTTHIAEITCPIFCAFISQTHMNFDLEFFLTQNFLGTDLVNIFRLTIHKDRESSGTVSGNKGNIDTVGLNRGGEVNRSCSSENAAPTRGRRVRTGGTVKEEAHYFASSPYNAVFTSADVDIRDAILCASA
jgi:hypothetical protein